MPFEITSKRPDESDYRSLWEADSEIFLNLRLEGAFVGVGVSDGADGPGSEASWLCSAGFPVSQRNHESIRIRWGADVCPACWEECQGPVADTHMRWRLYLGRLWKRQPGMELSVLSSTCLVKKPSGWLPSLSSSSLFRSIWRCSLSSKWDTVCT